MPALGFWGNSAAHLVAAVPDFDAVQAVAALVAQGDDEGVHPVVVHGSAAVSGGHSEAREHRRCPPVLRRIADPPLRHDGSPC